MKDSDRSESPREIDTLWDHSRPAKSEARFRELLPRVSDEPEYSLQLLTQIARAQGLQGEFLEAHKTLDEVQKRLAEHLVVARVRYLLERGRVFSSSGKPSDAKPYFVQAWETASSATLDFYAVDAAHMVAIVERAEDQVAWSSRAIEVASTSRDPRT